MKESKSEKYALFTFGGGIRAEPSDPRDAVEAGGRLSPLAKLTEDLSRQLPLFPDKLVATVDTLRTLPLLYRVNPLEAELFVIVELRQLLEALDCVRDTTDPEPNDDDEGAVRPVRIELGETFRSPVGHRSPLFAMEFPNTEAVGLGIDLRPRQVSREG